MWFVVDVVVLVNKSKDGWIVKLERYQEALKYRGFKVSRIKKKIYALQFHWGCAKR